MEITRNLILEGTTRSKYLKEGNYSLSPYFSASKSQARRVQTSLFCCAFYQLVCWRTNPLIIRWCLFDSSPVNSGWRNPVQVLSVLCCRYISLAHVDYGATTTTNGIKCEFGMSVTVGIVSGGC